MLYALQMVGNVFLETVQETLYLAPFFFLTYLVLEYLEHHTQSNLYKKIQKANKWGPLVGSLAGLSGGCGFSAVAGNFYAVRAITLGTLICIYLASSDEMLPLMITQGVGVATIGKIVLFKIIFAACVGFVIDFYVRRKNQKIAFHELCRQENCQCKHNSIVKAALVHTMRLMAFVFAITLVLNGVLGEPRFYFGLSAITKYKTCLVFIAALLGLIPSCSVSVGLTELYIQGVLPLDVLMAGLLSNAGVGLIVLYKMRPQLKEIVQICGILFICGVIGGHIAGILF